MNYIKKYGEKELWNHGLVELFDFSRANQNEESRIEAVTFVAGECAGAEPKDRKKLYERLKHESCGMPASSFEFVRNSFDPDLLCSLRNWMEQETIEGYSESLSKHTVDSLSSMLVNGLATFRIKAPIFIIRQIVRHRSFAYQELSRRLPVNDERPLEYWDSWENFGICVGKPAPEMIKDTVENMYNCLIREGERPEIARAILPLGTYSTIWMQGEVDAFRNYFEVRVDPRAQKEHQELAKVMLGLLKEHQPVFYDHVRVE